MGRPKNFSPVTAVRKALQLFWEKGFEGTSMSDLLEKLNISRSSFYDTFGDKQTIFLKTMDLFTQMMSQTLQSSTLYSDSLNPLDMIVKHFALNRKFQIESHIYNSCYISNCTIEEALNNFDVAHKSLVFFNLYKDAFKFALDKATDLGQIENTYSSNEQLAWYLVNTISGLGIMRRAGVSIELIDGIIITALLSLNTNISERYYYWVNELAEIQNPLLVI